MIITLKRYEYGKESTKGVLVTPFGNFQTLELPWKNNQRRISCIPEGMYEVKKSHFFGGKNKGKRAFRFFNVPERSGILIHIANYVYQLNGCVGVGMGRQGEMITNSKLAFNKLWNGLPSSFSVNIIKEDVKDSLLNGGSFFISNSFFVPVDNNATNLRTSIDINAPSLRTSYKNKKHKPLFFVAALAFFLKLFKIV